jgi:hypothetical protein
MQYMNLELLNENRPGYSLRVNAGKEWNDCPMKFAKHL